MLDSVLRVIQCDYGYLTDVGEELVLALFASCRPSTNLFATLCTTKGPKDTYVVAAFASWIWELGHARSIIQSDGIPPFFTRQSQGHSSGTDHASGFTEGFTRVERSGRQVRGMARVYLEHVREKTGSGFPPKSPWWAWALRHAAWIHNRFHERADTRVTPRSKIRLKTYAQPVPPFGELVLARRPGAQLQKCQTQFVYGCSLGRDTHTDEHIVGSTAGVFPHANGQETDRGQELVGRSCCTHGMDAVEDRVYDERQATKGCCWREE